MNLNNDLVVKSTEEEKNMELTISIYQLYKDALYAWQRLQTRRDFYGSVSTGLYFRTEVQTNKNSTHSYSLGVLPIFYSLYKISNDSIFLDLARETLESVWKYCISNITVNGDTFSVQVGYDWLKDETLDSSFSLPYIFVPIALEDSFYLPYFEKIISDSHALFWSESNLIHQSLNTSGAVLGTNCHLTWGTGTSRQITQLLWLYELTNNETYKLWADQTIEAIWGYRSGVNLLPRSINSLTGSVADTTVSHYDMAGWLNALELAFYLHNSSHTAGTGLHTYFDLINDTAHAISKYFWYPSKNRWVYKCKYNSGDKSYSIPEMNSIYVDYALLLAYNITGEETFLEKARTDFTNEFLGDDPAIPNGVLMDNSLIIHSPSTFSHQSQFCASANKMVARTAALLFQYSGEDVLLMKAKYHYNQLIEKHRFPKGYTHLLNTNTSTPYSSYNGNPALVFDGAPYLSSLALPSSFLPSNGTIIDWGYGLPTTMPEGYGLPGAFTGVEIDIKNRRVLLKEVEAPSNGTIFINFAETSEIENVIIDGSENYTVFEGNLLTCRQGTHSYLITFSEFEDITTSSQLPTTTSSTMATSSSSHSSSTSSSTSSVTTTETTSSTTSSDDSSTSVNTTPSTSNTTPTVDVFFFTLAFSLLYIISKRRISK
ncbi:MAG: hypothetical protein ACTSW1_04015 [Candidatus Hodarchaeales archaeon]